MKMDAEQIFDTYYDRVYRFALLRVQNVHDAENIASDVFLKVVENISRYDETKASPGTWLFAIAANTVRDFYRTRHTLLPLDEIEQQPAADSTEENPEESVLRNERAKALYAAIARLSEHQRDVVLLRYYGQMSTHEVARCLKLTETNVDTILSRAKKTLRNSPELCEISPGGSYNSTLTEMKKESGHAG